MNKTLEKLSYKSINYAIRYPENYNEKKVYPTLILIPGAGCRFMSLDEYLSIESFLVKRNQNDSAFKDMIMVFPQCTKDNWYCQFDDLVELIKTINQRSDVDKNKFNVGGGSMGGYTAYSVMMNSPELFHKALILCGGGMYWNAGHIKNIEFKIVHGEKDTVVYPEEARRMYKALKDVGAKADLYIYPNDDHNCWDTMLKDNEMIQWLLD